MSRSIFFLCFFLSGGASLMLESIWTRQLTLIFGSTTLAVATVTGVFMGGLSLGSFIAGRRARASRRPAILYAVTEIAIGLYALLFPHILRFYPPLNRALYAHIGDATAHAQWLLGLGRLGIVAFLLIVPTTLMGATLPLLARQLSAAPDLDAVWKDKLVATLYAVNTFGAVVGTFLGGLVFLPSIGVRATNFVAVATNVTLAIIVLVAARGARDAIPLPLAANNITRRLTTTERLVLFGIALSGAIAMALEVLWTRALAVVIGSSVYSFSLILIAFLIGLGGGSMLVARLRPRIERPLFALGLIQLAVAFFGAGSYLVMDKLPQIFLRLLTGGTFSPTGILVCQFILVVIAVLPCTISMGGVFPLTLYTVSRERSELSAAVGIAYSMNTIGAIVGSLLAGFVILPRLGLERGIKLLLCLSVLLGVGFLLRASRRFLAPLSLAAAGIAAVLFLPTWNLRHFSAGLFRISIARDIIEGGRWPLPELLFYKDGMATTVSVERWGKTIALKNNGKVDASNGDDMATQIMVGLLPLTFYQVHHPLDSGKPGPKVAVVGYGSGVTVGATTQYPIDSVDVVELESTVVQAGVRYFGDVSHHPEQNPRVHIHIGDGRNFLEQTPTRYDVIISEPSNPWITGVSSLFTADYFRLARSRLADDGVFGQWAQLYEMSPDNIKVLLKTFSSVFPYTYVFAAEDLSSDILLVAANHPLALDLPALRRNYSQPQLAAELTRGSVPSAEDLLAQLLLTPPEIVAFTAGAEINTDDNAYIEFAAPLDLFGQFRHEPYLTRIYGENWPYGRFENSFLSLGPAVDHAASEQRLARALLAHGKKARGQKFLRRANSDGPPDVATNRLFDLFEQKKPIPLGEPSADDPIGFATLDPPRPPANLSPAELEKFARDYAAFEQNLRSGHPSAALMGLRPWPERWFESGGADLQMLLGYALFAADLPSEAVDHLKPLLANDAFIAKRPAFLYYLARAEYDSAIFEAAVRNMAHFVALTQRAAPADAEKTD